MDHSNARLVTMLVQLTLFEDFDHPGPGPTLEEAERYAAPMIFELANSLYYEDFIPPVFWNYYFTFYTLPNMTSPERARIDFRDPETKEISDRAKYKAFCSNSRSLLRDDALEHFPRYDKNLLEDALEEIQFTYLPERCVFIASTLVDDIMDSDRGFQRNA